MVSIVDLWLPILVSAVVVFFASYVVWMFLPHHKNDWTGLPDEAGFFKAVKDLGIPSGEYMLPYCKPADWKTEEGMARYNAGPWGTFYLLPGKPNFMKNLLCTFIFYVVVGVFVGYLTGQALEPDADYLKVFQFSGTAAVMAYCLGIIPHDIFTGRAVRPRINAFVDGIVYGLLTAGVFGALWPAAQTATTGATP